MGATPQRCAHAASLRSRCAFVADGDQQDRGGVDADAAEREELGCGRGDEFGE